MNKIRVVHVINSFEYGGAEAMLCNLLLRADRDRFEPSVVALIDDWTVAGPLLDAGISVTSMAMRAGVPDPRGLARLARHLLRERPGVVQTWMDHSNLIGGLACRLACRAPVVWGLHHTGHEPGLSKRSTLLTVAACAKLSRRLPARVVCCSERTRAAYTGLGFAPDRLTVIPNGFDTRVFRPDPAARLSLRRELGLDPDAPLIGLVARFDPLKDHANFLRAAARLSPLVPGAHFVLCGDRVDRRNPTLAGLVARLGLHDRCHLLGPRRDVARVNAGLDLATSSSLSEAFPLAVGEAMACGVPCVVTDVGDSARMVGETGRVVPPRDPDALVGAWLALLSMDPHARRRLGLAARRRVQRLFDLGAVTLRYEALYEHLAAGLPCGPLESGWLAAELAMPRPDSHRGPGHRSAPPPATLPESGPRNGPVEDPPCRP